MPDQKKAHIRDLLITYPGLVSLLFQIGRTNRAKYNARPSRRPLNIAVPEPSPGDPCQWKTTEGTEMLSLLVP